MNPQEIQPDAVTKVARDLSAIEDLAASLDDQAEHKANDPLMPGGKAMVALASVANLEAWEAIFEAGEHHGRDVTHVEDEDDEWEPPLQTLCFWSEQWRAEHGYELDKRPTLASEINFVRYLLGWAWDNEPHFEDFARDIRRARVRLENLLYAGRRADRVRVHCIAADCETKPRLIKVYGGREEDDRHKCPACKTRYDQDDYARAYGQQLRSEGAERFVKITDAVGTLRAQGRAERTIRKWFEDCQVHAYCDPRTRSVWVWWPDLWRLHLSTATRKRQVA